jgi:flagellar basal body-associated protein FliL
MKLTLAVEFDSTTKEEAIKAFTPRIRDAILAHMRTLVFEDAIDSEKTDKLRNDLLERCHSAGARTAERILITDLVAQ